MMQAVYNVIVFTVSANITAAMLRHLSRKRLISTKIATTDVGNLRKEYSEESILDEDVDALTDPLPFFKRWFAEAIAANVLEPNAMCLATCSNNTPSARFVLLKAFDEKGFVWYTNYHSRKAHDLLLNPVAALTFWWGELERSVRIEGMVEKTTPEESDAYFNSRPRGSQIGAWSSHQSSVVSSREELEAYERSVLERFSDDSIPVPRPPHWGGFRLVPKRIEFWKGRSSRLHDRIVFERDAGSAADVEWSRVRLQP
jgi:pyridoxamine 5'-phosphate oxidase